MRPTWAEINLNSIRKNLETVKSLIGKDVSIMAVVKADAYGHGAVKVSEALIESGVNSLGVATLEEGLELRDAGIDQPIVILGAVQGDEVPSIVERKLTPTVYDIKILGYLSKEVGKLNESLEFHLKIDTGMSRLGIKGHDISEFVNEYRSHSCLKIKGIFTHLASAEDKTSDYTDFQISRFYESLNLINSLNIKPDYFHLANSAAIQNYPESHGNLVRPGIMIYGAWGQNGIKLYPVMSLKSKIIQIKMHDKGTPVSYGGTYITKRKSLIATVPIGYADGYSRKLSNKAFVSIKGKRANVVGSVCMDFIMIDVTDIEDLQIGDEVVLFGDDIVSIEDISEWADTIPYEIMTLIGKRVHRIFL